MSIDSWGGGSDNDPKLRKKELGAYVRDPLNDPGTRTHVEVPRYVKQKATSLFDLMMLGIFLLCCLIGYAAFR